MRSSPLTDFRILMKPELTYSREPVEFCEPPSRWGGGVNWTLRPSEIVGPPQTYLRPLGVSPWRFTTTSHPHPLTTPTPTHTPLHSYFTPTATLTHTHHTHTPLHSYFTPTAPPPSPATHPLPLYTCLFGIFKPGSFQPAIHHPPRLPLVSDIGRFHCLAPR